MEETEKELATTRSKAVSLSTANQRLEEEKVHFISKVKEAGALLKRSKEQEELAIRSQKAARKKLHDLGAMFVRLSNGLLTL